jgi:hypothetical protein
MVDGYRPKPFGQKNAVSGNNPMFESQQRPATAINRSMTSMVQHERQEFDNINEIKEMIKMKNRPTSRFY